MVCRYRTELVYDIYEINDKIDRSGTSVGESIFGVALVPSLGTLGINYCVPLQVFITLFDLYLSENKLPPVLSLST